MLLPSANTPNPRLLILEFGFTAIATALAFAWPKMGAGFFARIERSFAGLARKQGWAVAVVGASVIVLAPRNSSLVWNSDSVCPMISALSWPATRLCRDVWLTQRLRCAAFRKHSHHHAANLPVDVFPWSGARNGGSEFVFGHPWGRIVAG